MTGGETLCAEHALACSTDGRPVCADHVVACDRCDDGDAGLHCEEHADADCETCEETLCDEHAWTSPVSGDRACNDHRVACDVCEQDVAATDLLAGRCGTCRDLGEETPDGVPESFREAFDTVRTGRNDAYLVCHGHSRFGRDALVVLDRDTGEEVHRRRFGRLRSLGGAL